MAKERRSEKLGSRLRADEGAQLIELAVTLPLLVVMVVGVFDFGGAYHLKQNLSGAAREGARYASSLPTAGLGRVSPPPDSVTAIRDVVDAYLTANHINDCGLSTKSPAGGVSFEWIYTATGGGCPTGGLILDIERGYTFTADIGASQAVRVISTRVTITYSYKWQFGNVIDLLAPGANYAKGVSQIKVLAVVPNMD
ncbi:MAG TPA: TadE/TadG family type IV pilus assembly protein [Terriglobales bacterium]|nr:TadE/TadG family type IV pilus assembly protein [Terriglobales bacterium]